VLLRDRGWVFESGNGFLWRLSAAASFEREGFRVDLHWGLHAAHLPAWPLRALERALWERATPGESGMLEPDPESLLVFLAVHAAGHRFERPEWVDSVVACERLVRDWDRVWRVAGGARVESAVWRALAGGARPGAPLLDGIAGRALWTASWLGRGHFIPRSWRERLGEAVERNREGLAFRRVGGSTHAFAGMDLRVDRRVFPPKKVTEGLVELALKTLQGHPAPVVVEVGTGSGAVALALARARPEARVYASDISPRAVACARRNGRDLGLERVRFARGSLLEPFPASLLGSTSAVVSNVPYVPSLVAARVGDWGAPLATVVGPDADGLGLLRQLALDARRFLEPGGWFVFQHIRWQWEVIARDLAELGYRLPIPAQDQPLHHAAVGASQWPGEG
jgi:release factor glutamine methyltransferase